MESFWIAELQAIIRRNGSGYLRHLLSYALALDKVYNQRH